MPAMAWIDGAITPLAEARIPVTDRGFLWGDHVFEVIRAEGMRLCDGPAHLDRLDASAALLRMPAPPRQQVMIAALETLRHAALRQASVRIVWTRGDAAGLGAAGPRLVVMVEPLRAPPDGVRLVTVRGPRVGGLIPAVAKTGNHLGSVMALAAATAAGGDDALLVDDDDTVLETASANLFVVDGDGTIITPTGALLPGVTAARVVALLTADGHQVTAGRVSLLRARGAAELFITSSRRCVVPVTALDGEPRETGPTTQAAADAYAAWLASSG
jgi:branched-subunit amino acid aminotransferase/4-amino-4-deoxychorismate lyase